MADLGYQPGGTFQRGEHKIVKRETVAGINCRIISGATFNRATMPIHTQIKIGAFITTVNNDKFYISKG